MKLTEDMPEIYGALKKQKMSGEHTTPDKQDQRRLLGVALQKKLARAKAEADAKNFISSLDGEIDDVFELTPPATMTTFLTTPKKQVIRRSVSPVRAGNKVDYLQYQSPVRQKAVPVGVVSPSIKDTFRRLYHPPVQQKAAQPVVMPVRTKVEATVACY